MDEIKINLADEKTKSQAGLDINAKLLEEIENLKKQISSKPVEVIEKPKKKRVVRKKQEVVEIVTPKPLPVEQPIIQPKKAGFFKRLFSRKEKTYETHPQIQAPIKVGEEKQLSNFEYADVKKCPVCSSKISKSKVYAQENKLIQYIKCNSVICDFFKKIELER